MRSLPGKKVCGGHDGDGHDGDGHNGVDDIVTTMMGKKNMVGMRTIATNCTMIL